MFVFGVCLIECLLSVMLPLLLSLLLVVVGRCWPFAVVGFVVGCLLLAVGLLVCWLLCLVMVCWLLVVGFGCCCWLMVVAGCCWLLLRGGVGCWFG